MNSLLAKVLFEESIKQTDIANYIRGRYEPTVQKYQINAICRRRKNNGQIKTYLKIIEAVNALAKSGKKYTISDIIEPDFIQNELILKP
jgi:putative component of membrane protein insertase Oxa1/YidC/SpoIIIJ protein YidD